MSSSTFVVKDNVKNETLILLVRPDGTVIPDKETVKTILSNRQTMDINMLTVKKMEAGAVDVFLDSLTYVSNDTMQDPQDMTELERNIRNFRMDHDYTPFTSPADVPSNMDMVDELAQTLSMLEDGSLDPQITNEPLTKITKIVNGRKQTIFVNSKEKQRMINAGLLKEKPTEKVFKKPKPLQIAVEQAPAVPVELQSLKALTNAVITPKVEPVVEEEDDAAKEKKIVVVQEQLPKSPTVLATNEKKLKKPAKVIPETALFSTPDIIRRISKDQKEPTTPEKEKTENLPAKISPNARSKSNTEKIKEKIPEQTRRASLDTKTIQGQLKVKIEPEDHPTIIKQEKLEDVAIKQEVITKSAPDMAMKEEKSQSQVLVQDFSETMSNSNESIDDQLEPMPSAEDIRAMIHSENTKSFTMSTIFNENREEPSANAMNIDASSLELDQSILDDINTADLISEDILYQVAQSLVDNNTELQNVIDKSITEGTLGLDASTTLADNLNVSAASDPPTQIAPMSQTSNAAAATTGGTTQILRPDGRVVVIPPIERPTTRSRNRRASSTTSQPKSKAKPLDDQHVSGEELDSSNEEDDEDEDAESDDDPNKLWCICNQPHNNRFMICCDTCEEWYHGKCVNVTKSMGQTMEAEGKEWMCIYCKDPTAKRPAAAMRRLRKASRTSTESSSSTVKSKQSMHKKSSSKPPRSSTSTTTPSKKKPREAEKEKPAERKPGCVVCGKPSRNSSIYCSDSCILKHAQGVEKVVVYNRKTGHLLTGVNAPSASNLDKWLTENPSYEVVRSSKSAKVSKPPSMTQTKLKIIKSTPNAAASLAVQKKGGVNVGVLPHSPKASQQTKPVILNATLKSSKPTPVASVKVPSSKQTTLQVTRGEDKVKLTPTSSQQKPKVKVSTTPGKTTPPLKKEPTTTTATSGPSPLPQKTPKARQAEVRTPKQENLRDTVKKTFFEQLSNRLKNVDDLKLSDEELRQVSDEIESQLYKCFADTGQKYRNKYRSLIFNIKDPKNQTLWRRICEKSVNPYQLVRLSHDDLASQELALWRERETKHQLDMIKKSELELLNCSRQYVFKTHKGETVFEDDRAKDQVTEVLANPVADGVDGEQDGDDGKSGSGSSSKHSRRDRKSSRDEGKHRSSKSKRSRSRDRSSRHSERRRSRSRDRHRRHKSSRHKKDDERNNANNKTINTEKLDKKSKEILEQLVDKHIVPPLEDKMWKQDEIIPAPPPPMPMMTESDSDHEQPSSTVTIPTPPRVADLDDASNKKIDVIEAMDREAKFQMMEDNSIASHERIIEEPKGQEPLWKGTISMVDVAHISINAFEVSGDCLGLGEELPRTLEIVGRITESTVWDYIGKMKTSNSKSISILRLSPTTHDERAGYLSLYTYLSSRQRLGVVRCNNRGVKDFYILPLEASSMVPDVIASIPGIGFDEGRPSVLVGVLVRGKMKRKMPEASSSALVHQTKRIRVEVKTSRSAGTPPPSVARSYTPPPSSRDPRMKLPVPIVGAHGEENDDDMDEPYSPADSDPDSAQEPKSQLNASELSNLLTGGVKASSFLETGITPSAGTFEPFANKFEGIPGLDVTPSLPSNSLELEQKMAELDQKIAAQKAEIDKVSKDLVCSGTSDLEKSSFANISIPSNLQQILESIKSIGNKGESNEYQPATSGSSTDLTIPLLLPKLSSRSIANPPTPPIVCELTVPPPNFVHKKETEKPASVLSSLSEEELIKKAAEMLAEVEPPTPVKKRPKSPPPPIMSNAAKKGRLEMNQPPIPGLED